MAECWEMVPHQFLKSVMPFLGDVKSWSYKEFFGTVLCERKLWSFKKITYDMTGFSLLLTNVIWSPRRYKFSFSKVWLKKLLIFWNISITHLNSKIPKVMFIYYFFLAIYHFQNCEQLELRSSSSPKRKYPGMSQWCVCWWSDSFQVWPPI